jgi:hypothetical protein
MAASEIYAGVEGPVLCDQYNMKVTVKITAEPETVLRRIRGVNKRAEFW